MYLLRSFEHLSSASFTRRNSESCLDNCSWCQMESKAESENKVGEHMQSNKRSCCAEQAQYACAKTNLTLKRIIQSVHVVQNKYKQQAVVVWEGVQKRQRCPQTYMCITHTHTHIHTHTFTHTHIHTHIHTHTHTLTHTPPFFFCVASWSPRCCHWWHHGPGSRRSVPHYKGTHQQGGGTYNR